MRARLLVAAAAAVVAAAPAAAQTGHHDGPGPLPPAAAAAPSGPATISARFDAFAPSQVEILPGERVRWENVSERTHTVEGDGFASGDLGPGGSFEHGFPAEGVSAYRCAIHPTMSGEVATREVTLDPLPPSAVPAGDRVEFSGRTSDPGQPVRVERVGGAGARVVATAVPSADGRWAVRAGAGATGDYRAVSARGSSGLRRLLVSDRRIAIRVTRAGLLVRVTPPLPYARVAVQLYLPQRFGWWPQRTTRLDYLSEAEVPVRAPARVRVALLDRDGWTPLATSRAVTVRRARSSPGARPRPTPAAAPHGPGHS